MTVIIKQGDSPKKIEEQLKKIPTPKGFDAKKNSGKIKLTKTPLEIQKEMRS